MKSRLVPEEARATIYNLYRVPLNAIVLAVLLNHMETGTAFGCCAAMLGAAAVAQHFITHRLRSKDNGDSSPGGSSDIETDSQPMLAAKEW